MSAASPAGTPPDDEAGFRIVTTTRECLEYREGEVALELIGGWGVDPPVLHLPRAEDWDRVVPEAFRGRRDVIVSRLMESGILHGVSVVDAFA